MYQKISILFLLLLFLLVRITVAQDIPPVKKSDRIEEISGQKYYIHLVQKKQTIYGIARAYEVSVDDIIRANPEAAEGIRTNQLLRIPYRERAVPPKSLIKEEEYIIHKVLPKETLYSISRHYKVSIEQIKIANPDLTELLKEGQYLRIPVVLEKKTNEAATVVKTDTSFYTHKVKKKQTIYGIARLYGVTQEELVKYNPGIEEGLQEGQILKIPIRMRMGETLKVDTSEITHLVTKSFERQQQPYNCNLPVSGKVYNVALLIPLYVDECDMIDTENPLNIQRPDDYASFRFIQFYEGFRIALDTLVKSGLSLRLHVYDVDERTESVNKVINTGMLDEMDLIVGPFYTSCFKMVSDYVKDFPVILVNPFSNKNEVIDKRPKVFKLIPSLQHQLNGVADFVAGHYSGQNVIIVSTNNEKEKPYVEMLKKAFRQDTLHAKIQFKEMICPHSGIGELRSLLMHDKENVIITVSNDDVFVLNHVRGLKNLADEYSITLFGMPGWSKNTNIETKFLMKLNYHSFIPSLLDYDNEFLKDFVRKFREIYKTEPVLENYAFHGFDVALYFLGAMRMYGKNFDQCVDKIQIDLLTTRFEFIRIQGNGFENTFVNIFKYEDYKMKDARLQEGENLQ